MFTRRLGRSNIEVCAMGLGCMEMAGKMRDDEGYHLSEAERKKQPLLLLGPVNDDDSVQAIRFAIDAGVDLFDTAPAYGAGHGERLLGRALSGRRERAFIVTKFGKPIDEMGNRFGRYASAEELVRNIRKECDESLERLGTDYIDLYLYHHLHYSLVEQAEEVIETLEGLVDEGKIRYYGCSTFDPACARAFVRGPHCTAIEHDISVIDDSPELLRICEEFDQASIARGILGMGFLTGKYTAENYRSVLSPGDFRYRDESAFLALLPKLEVVKGVLTSGGRTIPQGAVAWTWGRSHRTIPIPGFRTLAQVKENVGSFGFGPLTEDQMEEIEILLGRVPEGRHARVGSDGQGGGTNGIKNE